MAEPFDEIRAALPEDPVRDAAVINVQAGAAEGEWNFSRLRVSDGFAVDLRDTIADLVTQIEMEVEESFAVDPMVTYEPGVRFEPNQVGLGHGRATAFHDQLGGIREWAQDDPLSGFLAAQPSHRVRAIALSVVGKLRVTVLRRRDPMQHFKMAPHRRRLLATFENGRLESREYVFAYDGGWDALLYGDDALVRDPITFEAVIGGADQAELALTAKVDLLRQAIPDPDALRRLTGHAPSRERLRAIDPEVVERLRSPEARAIVTRLEFDEVSLDEKGQLSFGTSNTARAQVLRLLVDGYLHSELTSRSYAASAKEQWPPRLVVTRVRRLDGVITHLCGDGWAPRTVSDVRQGILSHVARYSIRHRSELRQIKVSRAKDRAGLLWVESHGPDQDGVARGGNLLDQLPDDA